MVPPRPPRLTDLLATAPAWPLVMGILNLTPDSFSDGGRYPTVADAVASARAMAADGATVIDVGGESTRPGALPVPEAEQVARTAPVVAAIVAAGLAVAVSIDTTRAAVAAAAIDAGATVVNDVSAGRDDAALLPLVATTGVDVVLMHMRGTPATMQLNPVYDDVAAEVSTFLAARTAAAVAAGVGVDRVLVDPGIGFGKTLDHNLSLMRVLPMLGRRVRPVIVGTSRKGFIGRVTGEAVDDRRFGTAATVAWAAAHGAAVVRVHDVGPMARVVAMTVALRGTDGR